MVAAVPLFDKIDSNRQGGGGGAPAAAGKFSPRRSVDEPSSSMDVDTVMADQQGSGLVAKEYDSVIEDVEDDYDDDSYNSPAGGTPPHLALRGDDGRGRPLFALGGSGDGLTSSPPGQELQSLNGPDDEDDDNDDAEDEDGEGPAY